MALLASSSEEDEQIQEEFYARHEEVPNSVMPEFTKRHSTSVCCGACKRPSSEVNCKFFNTACNIFICDSCEHTLRGDIAEDQKHTHPSIVMVGKYARTLAEATKKSLDEQILFCEKIRKTKEAYKQYLSECEPRNKAGKTAFETEIYKVTYDLKRLGKIDSKLRAEYHELRLIFKNHDAVALIQKRNMWKNFNTKLKDIQGNHKPRLHLSDDGTVSCKHPSVGLEKFCFFRTVTGQDMQPDEVKKAWVLHAGDLYVFNGDYPFWEDNSESEIRPFVTLAEDNPDEVLMCLMQDGPLGDKWSKSGENSGQPCFSGVRTDRFGSTFVLGEGENAVYVHRGSEITKLELPVDGPSEYYSPVILCVDPKRELLCVYTKDTNNLNEEVYVYKITYTFESDETEKSIESCSEDEEKDIDAEESIQLDVPPVQEKNDLQQADIYNCSLL